MEETLLIKTPSALTCMLILEALAMESVDLPGDPASAAGREATRLRKALAQVPGYADGTGSDEGLWTQTRTLLAHEGYVIDELLHRAAAYIATHPYTAETTGQRL